MHRLPQGSSKKVKMVNSEAITVANQMHRTTLLNSLNTRRYVLPEERRRIHNAIDSLY